jgi:transcriptional regulator with XRE-family HTH domain
MARTGVRHYKKMKALIPSQLAALRAHQWTQEQFSEHTRLSVRRISEAENGRAIPARCAEIYARGLDRPVEQLFSYFGAVSVRQSQQVSMVRLTSKEVEVKTVNSERIDVQWMQFVRTLPWQEPYRVTECAWVYRFPGVGVDAIELSYDGTLAYPHEVTLPIPVRKAAKRWHHPDPMKERRIREEEWGLQVRLERVESSHAGAHVFHLTPMKYLYYVAAQQKLWSDHRLRNLRNRAFDNAVRGLQMGSRMILPSHFAIHLGVITRQGFALLRQRRDDTELYPSAWEAGIGEFMHGPKYKGHFPHFVRGKPNLAQFLKNAVEEELGYSKARACDFAIYGFAIEHQTLAPKLLVLYTSDADIEVLCEGGKKKTMKRGRERSKGAADWSPDVRAIKLNPREIATALRRFSDWGPTSRLTLMLALQQTADSEKQYWALVEEVHQLSEGIPRSRRKSLSGEQGLT